MEVLGHRLCEQHKKQANQICTQYECFLNSDILICPDCSNKHFQHRKDIIQVLLLNQKVGMLMRKRVEFEELYDQSCQALVTQLKKFKVFKEELFTSMNIQQRILNDLCKKIKRKVPYEKQKQLFKNHFGYTYLTMKGFNPNLQIYNKFKQNIAQTIKSCRRILGKFQLNCGSTVIPTLLKKEYQISAILKKIKEEVEPQHYFTPVFNKFKIETIKSKSNSEKTTKLMRINSNQFLSLQGECLNWYNINSFLFPKTFPLGKKLANIALMDKNAFITTDDARILIYDMINQKIIKEYESPKHKNASITGLLSINNSTVLNFITCPNQIVSLRFNQQSGSLKVYKGVETDSKQIDAKLISDNFAALYDNKIVSIYKTEYLDKQRDYQFEFLMKSATKISQNILAVGGQCKYLSILDTRQAGITSRLEVNDYCNNLIKIYPYSILLSCGKNVKIFDLRMRNEVFTRQTDDNIKNIEVLTSSNFITTGSHLTWWQSVQEGAK